MVELDTKPHGTAAPGQRSWFPFALINIQIFLFTVSRPEAKKSAIVHRTHPPYSSYLAFSNTEPFPLGVGIEEFFCILLR